jgi:thiol:disulfide interchange protein DsbA
MIVRGAAMLVGLLLLGSAASAQQNPSPPQASAMPFHEVTRQAGDENRVLYFFSFSCPYCRDQDERIRAWGAALPAPVSFDAYPIITNITDGAVARAYFAVELIDTELRRDAAILLYDFARSGRQLTPQGALSALKDVLRPLGLPEDQFVSAWRDTKVRNRMLDSGQKQAAYELRVTPSIGIAGSFVVSAADTNGDYDAMFGVANGLVSMLLTHSDPVVGEISSNR